MAQPTQCTICLSDKRHQVEIALVHRVPLRVIAKRYELSFDAIWRHGKKHLSPQMRAAILSAQRPQAVDLEQLQRSEAEGILSQLVAQRARLQLTVEQAQELGNIADVVKAEKAITDNLTLVAKLLGQLTVHHQVTHASVLVSPDYLKLRQVLTEALRPFPCRGAGGRQGAARVGGRGGEEHHGACCGGQATSAANRRRDRA